LPEWAAELEMRKMFWREYGLRFEDYTVTDIFHALQYQDAVITRQKIETDKLNRGNSG
jgi:hypothetical protein